MAVVKFIIFMDDWYHVILILLPWQIGAWLYLMYLATSEIQLLRPVSNQGFYTLHASGRHPTCRMEKRKFKIAKINTSQMQVPPPPPPPPPPPQKKNAKFGTRN